MASTAFGQPLGARLAQSMLQRPVVSVAIGSSAILSFALMVTWIITGAIGTDFEVYWRTANTPLFWAYWHGYEFPFPYMPTMLLWITPLKALPLWPAFLLWVGLSAYVLKKACDPYLSRSQMLLVLGSVPVVSGLLTGQVSIALAALLIWSCSTSNRWLAGMALGIVASIKPQLVLMVPLLLVVRMDVRAVVASVTTFAILLSSAILLYGTDMWTTWISALPDFRSTLYVSGIINAAVSPAAVAESFGLPVFPFIGLGGMLGGWLIWICRNRGPIETAAALCAGSILTTPYALPYDMAAVVPFLVLSAYQGRLWAPIALANLFAPLPILLTAFGLKKDAPTRELDSRAATPLVA